MAAAWTDATIMPHILVLLVVPHPLPSSAFLSSLQPSPPHAAVQQLMAGRGRAASAMPPAVPPQLQPLEPAAVKQASRDRRFSLLASALWAVTAWRIAPSVSRFDSCQSLLGLAASELISLLGCTASSCMAVWVCASVQQKTSRFGCSLPRQVRL